MPAKTEAQAGTTAKTKAKGPAEDKAPQPDEARGTDAAAFMARRRALTDIGTGSRPKTETKSKTRSPAGSKAPAGKRRAGGKKTGTKRDQKKGLQKNPQKTPQKDPKLAPRLTEKQENFLLKLLETDNQRLSYRFAYNCARMSDASVDTEASKLLKNPKVAQRFEILKEAARKRSSLRAVDRAARVLAELEKIGFDEGDEPLKVRDRLKALELLGKSEKLFTDRVDVSGSDNALEVVIRTVGGDGNAG